MIQNLHMQYNDEKYLICYLENAWVKTRWEKSEKDSRGNGTRSTDNTKNWRMWGWLIPLGSREERRAMRRNWLRLKLTSRSLTNCTFLLIDCTTLAIEQKCWWNINDFYLKTNTDNLQDSVQKVDQFLHTAVKRRIESSILQYYQF